MHRPPLGIPPDILHEARVLNRPVLLTDYWISRRQHHHILWFPDDTDMIITDDAAFALTHALDSGFETVLLMQGSPRKETFVLRASIAFYT